MKYNFDLRTLNFGWYAFVVGEGVQSQRHLEHSFNWYEFLKMDSIKPKLGHRSPPLKKKVLFIHFLTNFKHVVHYLSKHMFVGCLEIMQLMVVHRQRLRCQTQWTQTLTFIFELPIHSTFLQFTAIKYIYLHSWFQRLCSIKFAYIQLIVSKCFALVNTLFARQSWRFEGPTPHHPHYWSILH